MEWSQRELEENWRPWLMIVHRHGIFDIALDRHTQPFLNVNDFGPVLRRMRLNSPHSIEELAQKLEIRPSAYQRFERREERGTISIGNLRRCAAALDCDLVYAFRPKCRQLPSRRLFEEIVRNLKRNFTSKLYAVAAWKARCPKFRRQLGWVRNRKRQNLY